MMQQSDLSRLAARVLERNRATHGTTAMNLIAGRANRLNGKTCNTDKAGAPKNGSMYVWECRRQYSDQVITAVLPTNIKNRAAGMLTKQFGGSLFTLRCLRDGVQRASFYRNTVYNDLAVHVPSANAACLEAVEQRDDLKQEISDDYDMYA